MPVEILQVDSASSDHEKDNSNTKSEPKSAVLSDTSDFGVDADAESKEFWAHRAEKTELIPVEALKWNVDGDQSPCTCTPLPQAA